ncbi:hypothetical protein BY996DRAFT_6408689 [Phakopsora pachyrhizi]|nr:hypothetical protein BY996DRAFT_6408689 [Phakopsora pachyrhizi]
MANQAYSRLSNDFDNNRIDQDEELEAAFGSEDEGEDDQMIDDSESDGRRASIILQNNSDHQHNEEDEEEEDLFRESSSNTAHHPLLPGSSSLTAAASSSSSSSSSKKFIPKRRQASLIRAYDFEGDPYRSTNMNPTSSISTNYNHHHQQAPTPSQRPPSTVGATPTRLVVMGGGIQNDGVFANLSAKPDGAPRLNPVTGEMEYVGGNDDGTPRDKEEILPTYDSAALDSAPPYWETTVTLPGGGAGAYGILGSDDVLVDGLPVGNLFGFAWNLLVSMSFQFIGFLLTYLLHTTHAAKNGSRAGLGITLIQYGLYTRSRAADLSSGMGSGVDLRNDTQSFPETTTDPWGSFGTGSSRADWDGSSSVGRLSGSGGSVEMPYDGISPGDQVHLSGVANQWLSYMLIAIGWFLLLGGLVNYWRAVRWARAVRSEENFVGTLA